MFTRLRALVHHLNHSKMSTASGGTHVVNSNPACCSIPPVKSNYTPKGIYEAYAGFKKVYITGPPKRSDMAIVAVYDIFGFKPQTQQGADMLATAMNATVFMPDFFEPDEPFPVDRFPPESDKDKEDLQKFFSGPADVQNAVKSLNRVGEALKKDGAKWIGAYGMCWGGKVVILAGQDDSIFNGIAMMHPAMLGPDDGEKLAVPLGMFISKDEPKDDCEKIMKSLEDKPFAAKNMYKYYPTMFHGWAAARANLEDPENKKQFEDVYARLQEFFAGAFERNRGGTQT